MCRAQGKDELFLFYKKVNEFKRFVRAGQIPEPAGSFPHRQIHASATKASCGNSDEYFRGKTCRGVTVVNADLYWT